MSCADLPKAVTNALNEKMADNILDVVEHCAKNGLCPMCTTQALVAHVIEIMDETTDLEHHALFASVMKGYAMATGAHIIDASPDGGDGEMIH